MIYFTGDVHGQIDDLLRRLDYKKIPHTADQIIVLLGDVCVNYNRTLNEYVHKQKLQIVAEPIFVFMEIMKCVQKTLKLIMRNQMSLEHFM